MFDQEFCQSIEECDYVLLPPDPLGDSKTDILTSMETSNTKKQRKQERKL